MAETAKTYTLDCPICEEEFQVSKTPAELADGGDPIPCPTCEEVFEWEYDEITDTLVLVEDDEDEDEDAEEDDDDEDDDDETIG